MFAHRKCVLRKRGFSNIWAWTFPGQKRAWGFDWCWGKFRNFNEEGFWSRQRPHYRIHRHPGRASQVREKGNKYVLLNCKAYCNDSTLMSDIYQVRKHCQNNPRYLLEFGFHHSNHWPSEIHEDNFSSEFSSTEAWQFSNSSWQLAAPRLVSKFLATTFAYNKCVSAARVTRDELRRFNFQPFLSPIPYWTEEI